MSTVYLGAVAHLKNEFMLSAACLCHGEALIQNYSQRKVVLKMDVF